MANAEEILQQLSLEEKCALLSGVTNWHTVALKNKGVEAVVMSDGPHGMRKELGNPGVANIMQDSVPATCFPTAVTLASTWDRTLAMKMGGAIADEAIEMGVDIVLGPGVNIKRNPLCGRNFEYFSEDPYLAGEFGAAFVNGVQAKNVGTSLKHFAVNSQEYRRMTCSSEVDERTLAEIYMPAFEATVKRAQPYTVMCSYNPINGVHASDNKRLLTDVLRQRWGFKGCVISDWGAVNDRIKGVLAGMDIEMPTSNGLRDEEVFNAVKNYSLAEEDVNECAYRVLDLAVKCAENRKANLGKKADFDRNFDAACEIAENGAVLLKNDGILPLAKGAKIAVVGELAKTMRYQGTGSSRVNPKKLTSFIDYLDDIKAEYTYFQGYENDAEEINKNLIKKAAAGVADAETVIVFAGLTDSYEVESADRKHLDLPEAHIKLIDAVATANKNVIVVLSGGSPVTMPWLSNARAVLNMYLCGCAGGKACYRLLFGEVNPSGKLAETYPLNLTDNPAYLYFLMGPQTVEYRESIFVGYRYFDTAKKDVLFPFGFGLSYTNFEYSDLTLSSEKIGASDKLIVSFNVKNVGTREGKEVVQVYVKDVKSTIFREEKSLKGFEKVELQADESKRVSVELDSRAFAFYDVDTKKWLVEGGEFEILVGASSRDIRLNKTVDFEGIAVGRDYRSIAPCYYNIDRQTEIPAGDFEKLMGRPLRENFQLKKGDIDYNTIVADLGINPVGRLLSWAVIKFSSAVLPKGSSKFQKEMVKAGALNMPLRNAFALTNGAIPKRAVDEFIKRCNRGIFKSHMISAMIFKKKSRRKIDIYPL